MKKLLLLVIICVGVWFFFFKDAEAQVGFPFGGRILTVTPCANGLLIVLSAPTPMTLMYPIGRAVSYSYGPPRNPGQWLLGSARPGGVCNLGLFLNIPTAGTILYHGSSLLI